MKYIVVFVLLFTTALNAQVDGEIEAPLQQQNLNTEEQTKTKLGVKFTMGLHTFRGDAFDNERPLYGFGAGVFNIIHFNKTKKTNLHWELNMNFKGSKFAKPNDTSFSKISVAYLELPVYFSIQLFNTNKNQPMHLLIGGQVGYLFRSSLNKSYGRFGEVKTDLPFKKLDVSPVIGIRKEVGSGISLQLCAKLGLLNIYSNVFKERTDNPDLQVKNYDYRDITPAFKDGTHQAKNMGIEFSVLF
ncbi:MAG: outer membrane beta-barrel protein [Bacteroidia bacterium]